MPSARRYSTELRSEQTAVARRLILASAGRLFVEKGYLGTTLAAVAAQAGVSVQTVYNVIGGKSAVLKAVYDATLAGDDEPVAMGDRPAFRAMAQASSGREMLERYAELGRQLSERVLPLVTTLLAQAATGDPDLQAFAETIEGERAAGTAAVAQSIERAVRPPRRARHPGRRRHSLGADRSGPHRPPGQPAGLELGQDPAMDRQRHDRCPAGSGCGPSVTAGCRNRSACRVGAAAELADPCTKASAQTSNTSSAPPGAHPAATSPEPDPRRQRAGPSRQQPRAVSSSPPPRRARNCRAWWAGTACRRS